MKKKSKWHSIPWDTAEYLKEMKEGKDIKMHIIAMFAELKGYSFDNYQQMLMFIQRNNRIAKELSAFPLNKIKDVLRYLINTVDFKITLETVGKYIFEDIQILKGDEPIIILKDGSKIYDTETIRKLESSKKIQWDGKKWLEL